MEHLRRLASLCGDICVLFAVVAAFLLPFVLSGIVLALGALAVLAMIPE